MAARFPFLPRSPLAVASVNAAVVLSLVGFIPLFGGPGYEAALAAGIVLPSSAAAGTALDVLRRRRGPLDAFRRGCVAGAGLAALGLAIAFLHGIRVGFCDPVEGAKLFALGPGAGAVMGGVWGAVAGLVASRFTRRPRAVALALAFAGPLLGVVASLVRFYTSPMVFAFDPFFGFFAGTLYDSVITGLSRLATYRLGSLATVVAAGALAALWERARASSVRAALSQAPELVALAAAAGMASAVHVAMGPSLGHYQTAASIRAALGKARVFGRCELVYPGGMPEIEATALARECDGHLTQLEGFFDINGHDRVVAYLFASPDQKGELMGAATTYIAKPWRREIYIQRNGFPHPVMRHELAHVVAGSFGQGPFRVAGPLGGLVPDPGRIEGVAVAAAPHDEELSLDEWAKAMADLRLLPPLGRVFKLSFLGEPSSRAYVVAGAFIDWLRRDKGIAAVRGWYGGASLRSQTGETLEQLEARWRASIDRLQIGPEVLSVAKARFDQPAIFGRKCPHVVDRIAEEAGSALAQLDTARARALYRDLLALDPHDLGARMGLATCALREGDTGQARLIYDGIAAETALGRTVRSRAVEELGNLALWSGDGEEARRRFDEVASVVVDVDRLRTLDVKRSAIDSPVRDAILAHVLGDPRTGRDPARAAALLGGAAQREPRLGISDYLLARIYLGEGKWSLAAESLDRALGTPVLLPSVVREAYRMRVISACALEDREALRHAYEGWIDLAGARPPARAEMEALVQRCTAPLPENTPAAQRPPPSSAALAAAVSAGAPVEGATAHHEPSPASGGAAGSLLPPEKHTAATTADCPDGMVYVPAAETWIGSPRSDGIEDEWPRFRTRIAAFCMDRTEVTVSAYAQCVAAGSCRPADTSRVTCTARHRDGSRPINCVDATQADAYCAFRHGRLPTESEWEYAASGGDDRLFSWGNDSPDGRACWKTNRACPVASFPAGAFGLHDMTGNVWEWTNGGYGDYPWPPVDSPNRVYRGGSWSRRFDKWMRVRLRDRAAPSFSGSHLGFRCASTLPGTDCSFGHDEHGDCLAGVLEADCRAGKVWNGVRCAPPGEEGCGRDHRLVPGHGCVVQGGAAYASSAPLDTAGVSRARSPEFDADCQHFQPQRPHAYRFKGGTHDARNAVERSQGCKNRDVGSGWNSACCP